MERRLGRKLSLGKDTVRELTDAQLRDVAGGDPITYWPYGTCPQQGCGGGTSTPNTTICALTNATLTCGQCC